MSPRRYPIIAKDIRSIGGIVTVATGRDRLTSEAYFQVRHISGGGDIAFTSRPIADPERAATAAEILAEYTGASVVPT